MIGTTISHYRITAKLGEGGMGEVYRAEDTTLGREVAVKVLPAVFTEDAEHLARFEREAKLLATLNHPHIAQIHALEEVDGQELLIMELVDGETLAEQIGRGPLPLEDALSQALQIARALEAAHERGIVHRDLKPANIKRTTDGEIKVLDFGLAKPVTDAAADDLTHSPTLTYSPTRAGVLLGTAAYMSPEQARGQEVDKRTDIWAFGAVLWEILTGTPLFEGESVSDILAAVLRAEPEWAALPEKTPAGVRRLLRRCLTRNPKDRLHDIADARLELGEAIGETDVASRVSFPAPSRPKPFRRGALTALLATSVIGMLALAGWLATRPEPPAARIQRFELQPPSGVVLMMKSASHKLAISRDGRLVVFLGRPADGSTPPKLYLRSVGELEARPLAGTESAISPFFSPDGRWLAFWTDGVLEKVPLAGGEPVPICETDSIRGSSWGDDGTIVFGGGTNKGLLRVSAEGGEPEVVTVPDSAKGEEDHRWPVLLPDGEAALFVVRTGVRESRQRIAVVTLETGEYRTLRTGGTRPLFAATGHLIYSRLGTIYAVEIDPKRLELVGTPRPVLQDVRFADGSGDVRMDLSEEGSLIYVPGAWKPSEAELVWVDRQGTVEPLLDARRAFESPKLSPDGRYVATAILTSALEADIWIYELERQTWSRLTFEGGQDPVWSPDGETIVFSSDRHGPLELFRIPADGSLPAEQLTHGQDWEFAGSFSPDGGLLLLQQQTGSNNWDLLTLALSGEGTLEPVTDTPFIEVGPALSPDGRWLAHSSLESGRPEIYVREFADPDVKTRVSTGGGTEPIWHPNGRELFYLESPGLGEPSRRILSVSVSAEPEPTIGRPGLVVETDFDITGSWHTYDISPEGDRFLLVRYPPETEETLRLVYVPNWLDELEELMAADG